MTRNARGSCLRAANYFSRRRAADERERESERKVYRRLEDRVPALRAGERNRSRHAPETEESSANSVTTSAEGAESARICHRDLIAANRFVIRWSRRH